MEEENNRDGQNAAPVEEVSKEQVEQACEVQEQKKQEYRPRKNGRNKTGVRSSSLKSAPAKESCGEVEDISNFKEKLSGSNVSGYGSDKGKSFGDEGEKFRRRRREEPSAEASETADAEQPSQKSEAGAEETPAAEKTPEGPFFESKKFTPRAVEVPLTDKRPKFSNDKSPRDDGVVSYSAKMDCPSLSLFSRIKNAIASIFGKKPEHEKFPGAVDTYCVEAMMQDGKALQAGTSHFLGQNFAKSANISFVNKNNESEFAYTTSWGVSTRLIGGVIMTHADDEGMVVPPKIAPYQVVLVPVIKKAEDTDAIMAYINDIAAQLKTKAPFAEKIRIKIDKRDKSSVDKFWEWTRKGAPVICEIGMRDMEGANVMVKERLKLGTPEGKKVEAKDIFISTIAERLENIQKEMFEKAKDRLSHNIRTDIKTPEEFKKYFEQSNVWIEDGKQGKVAFVRGKWSGDANSEELLKAMKITIRCIPFDQSETEGVCLLTGKPATMDVIYARSY